MIEIKNLSVQFTGDNLFEDVSIRIAKHDKIALVGSNGTGKSTFLKLLVGSEKPESGSIIKQRGIKIGYLPQDLISFTGNTLFEEVKSSLPNIAQLNQDESEIINEINQPGITEEDRNELLEKLGEIHLHKDSIDYYSIDSRIEKVLMGLGFDAKDFYRYTQEFSGGWQMRIQLAKILLADNDILLMDEPTNHLDIDTLTWLENFLKAFKGALILISHDRHFVNIVTNKTLEIYENKINFYSGLYNDYLTFKIERDIQQRALQNNLEKKIKETERFIERFRYKSSKARQVQSRVKQLEKMGTVELTEEEKKIDIKFPEPPKSGIVPISLHHVSKNYGEVKVFDGINLEFERGDKIAIVGPNGAGKTTLAKIISGKIQPTSGTIEKSNNTLISYYEQEVVESLNPDDDLIDSLDSVGAEITVGQIRTILGSFLFSGDDVFKKIKVLSGGEKSRIALARLLLTKSNVIILDEPTNHLDFSSKEILQKALIDFSGTLIIVSHDVDFLKPIITKVLEIREHKAKLYIGGIDYYLLKREELQLSNSAKDKEDNENKTNRKDQKRIEAEQRQKKYLLTKDLRKNFERLEKNIEKLESLKTQLENELSDSKIFSNPELAKTKNSEYETCKIDLDRVYEEWSGISQKIEDIENSLV